MTWTELCTNISIGSIFSLKTKYKDFKAKSIGLDFYGFDAILPLKEISNNHSLSFALFNTIKKDEILSLVLIDVDDKSQKLTFSSKAFRNALDDVLPFTHCVNLINGNYRRRSNLPNNFLLEQRNTLNRLRGDLSSSELTFLYELVQNAVDHPNRNFNNNVSVTFEVFNNFLLVKHNGALFTENNFESITGILYGEQIQEGERNRIGYKGIGFKSVFRFTDNAYIRSGNFSFRFSKVESGSDKPWEVLPVFQLEKEMVPQIPQFDFFNAPVAFAFEFNSPQSRKYVIKYLNQLSQNPYLLIFLENLTQLKIKAPSSTFIENGISRTFKSLEVDFIKETTKGANFNSINLFISDKSHSEWLIYTKNDILISDEEVVNELIDESVTAVPTKMRKFRTPSITIALPKKRINGDFVNLFTYLPLSNTRFKLPFLVNADFIPDLDRTDIIHNLKYNREVLKFVAVALQEFAQKLADNNHYEYLNTLLPDFNFEYQSSGSIIVNSLLDYLPQTKITFDREVLPLSKIAVDKTAFDNSFGLETYKSLIDADNVPLGIVSNYKSISKLVERINPEGVFNFSNLREKVKSETFKEWLKNPMNNSNFLKYLFKSKYLDVFKDELIFLGQDGALYKGSDLLVNLGDDELDIQWLNFGKVIHRDVLYNLSDTQLPLSNYEPISFIKEIICKKKKVEVITGLTAGSISFDDFYCYLAKYASSPLFPAAEIKSFPLKTLQATLPDWSAKIYFRTSALSKLSNENALPDGLYHLLNDDWSRNANLSALARLLGAITFLETEPLHFLQTILKDNKEAISRFYFTQTAINGNATLWAFILLAFQNLSDPQKESVSAIFKSFPVFSKSGVFKELQTLYLSTEFTDNDALETLSLQFPNSNIDFVSADYLKHPAIDKLEVRTLFKKLDAKTDSKDFLKHTLLPNLNQIDSDLFVPLTRLLYENRESESIINAVIRSSHFKLKTKEGAFKRINECLVGSPYIDETQIPNPLNSVPIINQISEEYSNSNLDAWQRFFSQKLKVSELKNEAEILNLKLKYIADNIQLWQNADASISLLSDIYILWKSERLPLTQTNLNYLKGIPLLCKGDSSGNFHNPNAIHFSSAYKPTFDFEKIFGIQCGVPFLSEKYKFEDSAKLIKFFEQIGVSQYFEQSRHTALCQNIPTADGQAKPASQLFKYKLKNYVGASNVAFEDLSQFTHNGKTLEDLLGFNTKLDVSSILNYITRNEPSRRELKVLISELLKIYNPSSDRNLINNFISEGKLLSSAHRYNFVKELHSIDESIRSGIHENEYLIDPLFNKKEQDLRGKYLKLFNIKTLCIEDFNPHFESEYIDNAFSNRIKERLILLAFDSDSDKYLEIENEFREKLNEWSIKKCSRISLKYPSNDSKIIKEDNRNFILTDEKTIYYIGNWVEQRNYLLVLWLNDNILNIGKQLQFVQDILLNDPLDIISDFENKGRQVPEKIKERFLKPLTTQQAPSNTHPVESENTAVEIVKEPSTGIEFDNPFKGITPEDETFIRGIIKGDFELSEKLDANTTAKIKTLLAIKGQYNAAEIIDEGRFLKAGSDEIIVRSAQKGLLYLDIYHWGRLIESNVWLSMYTKSQIEIFKTQEDLIKYTKPLNNFGLVRMPNDYGIDDYNSLDNLTNKGKWHYVFIVNENTQAAKSYKEAMDYSNPDLFAEDNF